jgi:hypothetical protein
MTEHDDLLGNAQLIREAWADWSEQSEPGTDWESFRAGYRAALEARPSLVADTREALAEALHYAQRFDDWGVANEEEREWSLDIADALLAPGGPVRLADAIRAEVIAWIADGDSTPSIRRSVKNAREHFGLDGFTRRETGQ